MTNNADGTLSWQNLARPTGSTVTGYRYLKMASRDWINHFAFGKFIFDFSLGCAYLLCAHERPLLETFPKVDAFRPLFNEEKDP